MGDDMTPTDAEVEAVARAAYIAINRSDDEPAGWWDDLDWEDYHRPEKDWGSTVYDTWPSRDTFRIAARAAIAALDRVRATPTA